MDESLGGRLETIDDVDDDDRFIDDGIIDDVDDIELELYLPIKLLSFWAKDETTLFLKLADLKIWDNKSSRIIDI